MFVDTSLYDQDTFYKHFEHDLISTNHDVIIESPLITERRQGTIRSSDTLPIEQAKIV